MEEEIINYVRTCKVCQAVKARRGKALGLLQQMLIPSRPWDVISMDFIVDLPPSRGHNILMVVVDFFSKQAHFIPAKPPLTANHVAHLFFKYVFKYHGLPKIIISDRDPRFTSSFWQGLFGVLGTRNFVCRHRLIHRQMVKPRGLIKVLKTTFGATSGLIRRIGWIMLTS